LQSGFDDGGCGFSVVVMVILVWWWWWHGGGSGDSGEGS